MNSKCKNNFCLLLAVFMFFNTNTYAKDESLDDTLDSTSSVAETSSSSAQDEDDFDEESSESDVIEDYSSTQKEDTSSESTTYSQSYSNSTSSYISQTNSNQKSSSTLLPKTKVDDSNELNSNDLQLVIDENTPKDFDFIQNSEEKNPGNVEWMKTLGIVFLLLACAGFMYTLLGLMSLRSSYKRKKIKR